MSKRKSKDFKEAAADKLAGEMLSEKKPEQLDENLEKELDELGENQRKKITDQVSAEYTLAYGYIKPKRTEWETRLKMYNNQRRNKTAVGDPLIFTTHMTIIAALYDDRLQSTFLPRTQDDEEVAENLTLTAQYDYDRMEKDILDYNWTWDTGFFGRGLVMMNDFDRETLTPIPENIDPMTFLRDPRATSVNGDMIGRGQARFFGRETLMTKPQMLAHPAFIPDQVARLKKDKDSSMNLVRENKQARNDAQGRADQSTMLDANCDYLITEWWTWWEGKPTLVRLGNNRTIVVGFQQFEPYMRRDGRLTWNWNVVDRTLYPISHDWDGVSIPDLTEDKQRARSVVQNLSLQGVKSGLFKGYAYDETKIKNRADLNFGMNKHVGVQGNPSNAIAPIARSPVTSDVGWIMDVLDAGAQKATATPEIQQGALTAEKRTLGELQIVERKVDTRFALSAKLFSNSEKRFWRLWYSLYKTHFKQGIDAKIIRFKGELGADWRPLTRENLIANVDPDVEVESTTLAEAKRMNELQLFSNYARALDTDPQADRRYILRHMGKLSGLKTEQINRVLPPTADEMRANDENKELGDNKLPKIDIRDDHQAHILIHSKAKDGKQKQAHINAHKQAMMEQKNNPELIPASPAAVQAGQSEKADLEAANYAPRAPTSAQPRS